MGMLQSQPQKPDIRNRRHFHLGQPDQTRAEHTMDISMKLNSICRLGKAAGYVIQTSPHPNDFNRYVGFMLSWTLDPLLRHGTAVFGLCPLKTTGLWPTTSPTLCWYKRREGWVSHHIKTLIMEVESILQKFVCQLPGIAISLRKFYWILLL